MLLARARNGGWKKSKVGGWWVLITTTRSWSDLLRCQSVTSSSPSHDNGFTILHKTTVNYASYLFQVLLSFFNKSSSGIVSDFQLELPGNFFEETFLIFRDQNRTSFLVWGNFYVWMTNDYWGKKKKTQRRLVKNSKDSESTQIPSQKMNEILFHSYLNIRICTKNIQRIYIT